MPGGCGGDHWRAGGQHVREELGDRQRQRTDLELVENFPQVRGEKTRDIAAGRSLAPSVRSQ